MKNVRMPVRLFYRRERRDEEKKKKERTIEKGKGSREGPSEKKANVRNFPLQKYPK